MQMGGYQVCVRLQTLLYDEGERRMVQAAQKQAGGPLKGTWARRLKPLLVYCVVS